jgi:hypothetical protein
MSFSVKSPDWSLFSEREVPFEVDLLSPASEMAAALQQSVSSVRAAREETEGVRSDSLSMLAKQAVLVVQMDKALAMYENDVQKDSMTKIHRHLRILKDQMFDALKKAGLEIVVPFGQSFEEVSESVHVQGWRHGEQYQAEIVAEVLEPSVWYCGRLVHLGRVIMGAPIQPAEHPSQLDDR